MMGGDGNDREPGDFYSQDSWFEGGLPPVPQRDDDDPLGEVLMLKALMRLLLTARPGDIEALRQSTEGRLRAALSRREPLHDKKRLSENLSALLKNLGDQILPPDR